MMPEGAIARLDAAGHEGRFLFVETAK